MRWQTGQMAREVTIGEAKTHFSQLIRRAEAGEEIVVRRGHERVARIAPLERRGEVEGFGSLRGQIEIGPDFDAPLADFTDFE